VFTEEPSQPVTPLSNEPAGFPEQPVRADLQPTLPPPPPVQPDRWGPWLPWLEVILAVSIWVGSVVLLIAVPLALAIPYFIYIAANRGFPSAEAIATDKNLIILSVVGTILAHIITIALLWFYGLGEGYKGLAKRIGFHWPRNITPLMGTLLCSLLAFVLLGIGLAITHFWGGEKTQLDLIVESSIAARWVTAFAAFATAPLVEEVIYRGVLYSALQRAAGVVIAVIVVSLLFAGVHVAQYSNNIGVILVITLLSVTLTLTRAYTGSVIPPFIIHLVFNGIQSLILVLTPFLDKSILNGGEEVTPTAPGFESLFHLIEKLSVYLCRMT